MTVKPGYHAVVIGVGSVGDLPQLAGARRDAQRFADWASPRYKVVRLIDGGDRKIRVADVQDAIDAIVEGDETIERLLLYYSGHGVALADGDYWLLSDFFRRGDECINVALSLRTAREHPIAQIGVIADACRSSIPEAMIVNGRNVFPRNVPPAPKQPKVDALFATRPGAIAQEVAGDPAKVYGVFSDCILNALKGVEAEAIDAERHVVSSQSLADWLEEEVPERSGMIPGGIVQYPSVDHGWGRPDDWYVEIAPPPAAAPAPAKSGKMFGAAVIDAAIDLAGAAFTKSLGGKLSGFAPMRTTRPKRQSLPQQPRSTPAPAKKPRSAKVASARTARAGVARARQDRIAGARGRRAFETQQGFTVVGMDVVAAVAGPRRNPPEIEHDPGGHWHVRSDGSPQSIAIELADGRWLGAIALPQFIGTIVVDAEQVLGVSYRPSANTHLATLSVPEPTAWTEAAARWNALLSVGADVSRAEFRAYARLVRQGKAIDPSLGILAAYAYDRGGTAGDQALDSVDSVATFMANDNGAVPFDVAFLSSATWTNARAPVAFNSRGWSASAPVAGAFPAMTQGWGLLEAGQPGVSPRLIELRRGLLPGVWTSFGADAGTAFAHAIAAGELT